MCHGIRPETENLLKIPVADQLAIFVRLQETMITVS